MFCSMQYPEVWEVDCVSNVVEHVDTMQTVFLKLGGSLITDKRVAETPRLDVITRLARELAEVRKASPDLRLVIGHGSGSFGHVHAQRYATRSAVVSAEQWYGFAVTADAAARLNRIVVKGIVGCRYPSLGDPA